jgi:hypothetical protein
MPDSVGPVTDPRIEPDGTISRPIRWAALRRRTTALAHKLADRDDVPILALAAVVVGMTLLLARIAVTNHYVFIDEFFAISFGRNIADEPSLAFEQSLGRGPERLTSLMTALMAVTSDSPSQEMWLLHAAMALCQGLVAVPVWLAGRELGLGRWGAVAAAAVAASGSFAIYGVTTLNQSVGLLCATVMLWGMVRALRRPGLGSDLLVLVGISATALARLGWAPLVLALVPGTLAAAWFERPSGERLVSWLRALPSRLLRRHPVLLPVLVLGVLAALVSGPSTLLGGEHYGGVALDADIRISTLWDNARRHFSHLAIGVALTPFILAIPALVRDLVGPRDATSGGFAWLVVGLLALFSYIHYTTAAEDRYLAVLVPPVTLTAALAVFRRPPPVWAVVVSGLLTARLVATSYEWPPIGPFDYFMAPTSVFFEQLVGGDSAIRVPLATSHGPTVALLLALAAAAVVAIVARQRPPRGPLAVAAAAAVLVGVVVFQVAAAEYPARKFVEAVGMPDVPTEDLTFVDRAARGGRAQPLAVDGVINPDLVAQLWWLWVYNRTLGNGMTVIRGDRPPPTTAPALQVRVDWQTGAAATTGPVPDILLEKPGFNGVGFSGTPLPGSSHVPFAALERLRRPLNALWLVDGDSVQGYPQRGDPLRLRVFPPTDRRTCVRGGVAVHPLVDRPSRYRLSGAAGSVQGVGQPKTAERFEVRVPGGQPTTLVLRGDPGRLVDGAWVGPTLVDLSVAECG